MLHFFQNFETALYTMFAALEGNARLKRFPKDSFGKWGV